MNPFYVVLYRSSPELVLSSFVFGFRSFAQACVPLCLFLVTGAVVFAYAITVLVLYQQKRDMKPNPSSSTEYSLKSKKRLCFYRNFEILCVQNKVHYILDR